MIKAECDRVRLSGLLKAIETPGHASLAQTRATQAKACVEHPPMRQSQLNGGYSMKGRLVLVAVTMLLVTSISLFAKGPSGASADAAYWVAYWAKPRVVLYGPEEQAFNENMHEITFAHDRFDHALDESTLNADVQWLKAHPDDRFFIEGYASATGTEAYNLNLSGQRAWWVRELLIRKGIAAGRILLAVPWGMRYPACLEDTEECHAKNRVVRFAYYPNLSNTAE
jgi:outer membrane protein OmpA-like peptidoglycan-associated protein